MAALKADPGADDQQGVLSARYSLASVPRGTILAVVGAWTVLLHVLHLVLIEVTATPAHLAPIIASAAAWALIAAWGLHRGSGMSSGEVVTALCCGAVAITADGVWGTAPGHAYLVSAALVAIMLAVGALSDGRTAMLGNSLVLACQCALLLAVLGTGPLGVYVALATTATTCCACVLTWWLQGDLVTAVASTREAAAHDPLTGLLNRRGMSERFPDLRATAPPGHRPAAVVLDLDHFKRINDAHGHDAGDQVLVLVAEALRARARHGDLVVRLGGEELAWLGAWASPEDALRAADHLRAAIAAVAAPGGLRVTASLGVAFSTDATQASQPGDALSRLLVRADAALYGAKATGRDRAVLAAPALPGGPAPHDGGAPALQVQDGGSEAVSAAWAAAPDAGQRA